MKSSTPRPDENRAAPEVERPQDVVVERVADVDEGLRRAARRVARGDKGRRRRLRRAGGGHPPVRRARGARGGEVRARVPRPILFPHALLQPGKEEGGVKALL